MEEAYVKHDINNKIATIEFFHPKSNALPSNILAELARTISFLGDKNEVLAHNCINDIFY
jgi:methylglutaconyl-CoA hydratase